MFLRLRLFVLLVACAAASAFAAIPPADLARGDGAQLRAKYAEFL